MTVIETEKPKAKWGVEDMSPDLRNPPQTVVHHESAGLKALWSTDDTRIPQTPDLTPLKREDIL